MKNVDALFKEDELNTYFVRINQRTGAQRQLTLTDHHSEIGRYNLSVQVPQKVTDQYEVARNIYLYAWFEYRFFNVAEAKALTVLEFAIKQRVSGHDFKHYCQERKRNHHEATGKKLNISTGLKGLIEYCRDNGLIQNQNFSAWQRHATMKAYHQAIKEQQELAIAEMDRTGAVEIHLPDIPISELPPDPNYDHTQHLVDTVNRIRNDYAHGSSTLHNDVLGSFEMVSEFINQIYKYKEANNVE